jgi:hypothetical protein
MVGETIALALAAAAFIVSMLAYRSATAGRSDHVRINVPNLRVLVHKGQAVRSVADDTRDYVLLAELTNDADAAITISGCQLRVTYRTRANFLGAVDLDLRPGSNLPGSGTALVLPMMMAPRSTAMRSVSFTTSNVIPRHCRVQDYALIVSGEGGERVVADASLPALLVADTDGQGPSTWGWD